MSTLLQTRCPILRYLGATFALWLLACPVGAAPAEATADQFYDPAVLQSIHLEIAPEDLARLQRALPERIYVPGKFRWENQSIESVGIRYKGDSSSHPGSLHKRGFLIQFAEFKKGQRFLGLRHVALDNGIEFGSLFSERLITDVLRDLDVRVSHCNYAKVYLNSKYLGVYVNVERIDEAFLAREFGEDRGTLFKVDHEGPGADLRYLGKDPALYQKTLELHVGKPAPSYKRLVEFMQTINSDATTSPGLGKVFNWEPFLKTTAVMLFAGAFDQYTGWGPHNYYLYWNPTDQRWTYIPWDLDVGFADQAFGRIPVLEGWHAAWPAPLPGRPLMERLISDPALLQAYRKEAGLILEKYFRPEVLIPRLRGLYEQIRPALEEDPYPPRRATVPGDSGYPSILSSMETFIQKRYTLARGQLDNPGERPKPLPMLPAPNPEGPQPGPPSENAPSDLKAVSTTPTRVELRWVNHAEGGMASVVQRCTGTECTDFANHIGQPGENVTSAVDSEVRPGMTYRYRVYSVLPTPGGPKGTGTSNVVKVQVPEK